MDKEDLERQLLLIENNVNVTKTNDGKEFLILLGGLLGVLLMFIFFADFFANVIISYISPSTQMNIEKMFGKLPEDSCLNNKYKSDLTTLQNIRTKIIEQDTSLINNGNFPIVFVKNKDLNAWIIPNGTIYFTTTLLDKKFSEEELAFILAHEIGHYKHRDHLRTISRQIIIGFFTTLLLSNSDARIGNTISNVNTFAHYSHSRRQEKMADMYASKMLIKIYGSNKGGVEFFKYLKNEDKAPEFMQYFLTHPSPKKRLYLITHK